MNHRFPVWALGFLSAAFAGCELFEPKPVEEALTTGDLSRMVTEEMNRNPDVATQLRDLDSKLVHLDERMEEYQRAEQKIAQIEAGIAQMNAWNTDYDQKLLAYNEAVKAKLDADRAALDVEYQAVRKLLEEVMKEAGAAEKYKDIEKRIQESARQRRKRELEMELSLLQQELEGLTTRQGEIVAELKTLETTGGN